MSTLLLNQTSLSVGEVLATSGVCFVFILCVLALLIGVIMLMRYCLNQIQGISQRKKETVPQSNVAETVSQPIATKSEAKGSSGGVNIYNVDPKEAAMLMAIVADELKMPLNRLKFKSIKYVGEVENTKN